MSGKAKLIDDLRQQSSSPLLLVDSGNLLFKKHLPQGVTEAELIVAHGLLRGYQTLKYDAIAVSSNDLLAHQAFFQEAEKIGFPWLSANAFSQQGELVFRPHLIKTFDGLTVGIIGLTGTDQSSSDWAVIGDWRDALLRWSLELMPSCDILIVLSNLSDSDNEEIARDFPQIAFTISADHNKSNFRTPHLDASHVIAQVKERGEFLGRADIRKHPQGGWRSPFFQPQQLHNISEAIERQIAKLQTSSLGKQDIYPRLLNILNSYGKLIAAQINSLQPSKKEQGNQNHFAPTEFVFFLPIQPNTSNGSVDNIVQALKKSIETYYQHKKTIGLAASTIEQNSSSFRDYTGFRACTNCHKKQSMFWTATPHADAYRTLKKSGQSYNPECLSCHVTSGNISTSVREADINLIISLPEDRMTVGCEVCHGPGGNHVNDPTTVRPLRIPSDQLCRNCHTKERDDTFDYKNKIGLVACPKN